MWGIEYLEETGAGEQGQDEEAGTQVGSRSHRKMGEGERAAKWGGRLAGEGGTPGPIVETRAECCFIPDRLCPNCSPKCFSELNS